MKTFITILLIITGSVLSFGQTNKVQSEIENVIRKSGLDSTLISDLIKQSSFLFTKIDSLKDNPDFYDKTWNKLIEKISSKDSIAGYWLNSLNLDFKTMQSEDTSIISLGVAYDFNFERGKIFQNKNNQNGISGTLNSKGNIAFNKKLNPTDFLDTKLSFKYFQSWGGINFKLSEEEVHQGILRLLPILMSYTDMNDLKKSQEWEDLVNIFKLKNSYLFSINVNGGLESNQDFSKTQYAYGSNIGLSAKSWESDNLLSKLNIFDYPFALIRLITNTDNKLLPDGATLPVIMFGLDYVVPQNDTIREDIDPDLSPFFRIKFEAGFRTVLAKAFNQTVYFNAVYKYFNELAPSKEIKQANLAKNNYIALSLTSDKGFFVSYSYGRLPFDRTNDSVYQLGFNYKFD